MPVEPSATSACAPLCAAIARLSPDHPSISALVSRACAMAPLRLDPSLPSANEVRMASSIERRPATYAAATSPIEWPVATCGRWPAARHRSAFRILMTVVTTVEVGARSGTQHGGGNTGPRGAAPQGGDLSVGGVRSLASEEEDAQRVEIDRVDCHRFKALRCRERQQLSGDCPFGGEYYLG
eukprot:1423785-Prymnesium_polylepis.1